MTKRQAKIKALTIVGVQALHNWDGTDEKVKDALIEIGAELIERAKKLQMTEERSKVKTIIHFKKPAK